MLSLPLEIFSTLESSGPTHCPESTVELTLVAGVTGKLALWESWLHFCPTVTWARERCPTHCFLPPTTGRQESRSGVIRAGELALPLTYCRSWENKHSISPGQCSPGCGGLGCAGSEGMNMGDLALPLVYYGVPWAKERFPFFHLPSPPGAGRISGPVVMKA